MSTVLSFKYFLEPFQNPKIYDMCFVRKTGGFLLVNETGWYMPNGVYADFLGTQYTISSPSYDGWGNLYFQINPAPADNLIHLTAPPLAIDVGNFQDLYRILSASDWAGYGIFFYNQEGDYNAPDTSVKGLVYAIDPRIPSQEDLSEAAFSIVRLIRRAFKEYNEFSLSIRQISDIWGTLAQIGAVPNTGLSNYAHGFTFELKIKNSE